MKATADTQEAPPYEVTLRAIGQILEALGIESFEVVFEGDNFVVYGGCRGKDRASNQVCENAMTVKSLIVILSILAGYFTSTWFVFGSSHPCEILLVRQKGYHLRLAEKHHEEDLKSWHELARKALPAREYERFGGIFKSIRMHSDEKKTWRYPS